MEQGDFAAFLEGARAVDEHFASAKLEENVPAIMGLLSVWNVSFLGYPARAVLPYSEALALFPAHLQQLSMESNGKGVDVDGNALTAPAGEVADSTRYWHVFDLRTDDNCNATVVPVQKFLAAKPPEVNTDANAQYCN